MVFRFPGNTIKKASCCQAPSSSALEALRTVWLQLEPAPRTSGPLFQLQKLLSRPEMLICGFSNRIWTVLCCQVLSVSINGGSSESHSPFLLHLIVLLLSWHHSCFLGNLRGFASLHDQARGTKPHASQTPNSAPSGAVSTVPRSFLTGQARTICEPLLCTSLQASCDRGLLLRPFEGLLCDPVKMGSALRLSFLSHPVSFPCSCSSITQHLWPGMGYQKCRNPLIDSVLPPDLL